MNDHHLDFIIILSFSLVIYTALYGRGGVVVSTRDWKATGNRDLIRPSLGCARLIFAIFSINRYKINLPY